MSEGRDPRVQQLIEENVPLVQHVVYQATAHFPRHVDKKELVSAGVLGLVQAAHRYDPDKGVPFAPFAAQRIRGAILDAVRRLDWAPRSVRRAGRDVESAVEGLSNSLGRVPTQSEVAESLGLTPDALARIHDEMARSMVLGLDVALSESDSFGDPDVLLRSTVCETAEPIDEALCERELGAYVRDAVALLPERHRAIIQGYFFDGRSSEELAAGLGVTVSRISQIRSEAFAMMRQGLEAQYDDAPVQPVAVPSKRTVQRSGAYAAAIATRRSWRSRLGAVESGPVRLRSAV